LVTSPSRFAVRPYQRTDESSWVRCRALSFLSTQYYDDVKPSRTVLTQPAIALVAVSHDEATVIGILDIELDGETATIDTIATHPDHQHRGVATGLLRHALPMLRERGASTLDAWTREDVAANGWYQRNAFVENYRYVHVYLGDTDDHEGFQTPTGLSLPVIAFMHGKLEDENELRRRYARTYICRQYIRPVSAREHDAR
jgi:ribosomal protein S18 acetylase RimI-like enzyme